jgi:hypothetical protein
LHEVPKPEPNGLKRVHAYSTHCQASRKSWCERGVLEPKWLRYIYNKLGQSILKRIQFSYI